MSSVEVAAKAIGRLNNDEWLVLLLLGRHLRRFRIFPLETLSELSGLPVKSLVKISDSLHEKELVRRVVSPYPGLMLTLAGFDLIALRSLALMGVIDAMNGRIGTGKESDIYAAQRSGIGRLCVKFYRIGRTSFRDVVRRREFGKEEISWLLRSIKAAEREYKVLKRLYSLGVKVPKPYAHAWHAVAMEFLDGEIVAKAKKVRNPDVVLEEILEIVKHAYRAGYVNGDLSAFNVFVTSDERVLIIDWPQAVRREQKNALEKLKQDLSRVCLYFNRRFGLNYDPDECFRRVISEG